MLKLGVMHAMLLDFAAGDAPRRPRLADGVVQALAPFDTGLVLLRLMERLGILDAAQADFLRRREGTAE